MELNYANLNAVFSDCLFTADEVKAKQLQPGDYVAVQGVVNNVGFHPERLESHREDIASMLLQLPDAFLSTGGGGMSMLQMPFTKDGTQYGEQSDAEKLYMLGKGLELADFLMPREMWSMMPGGLPYIVVYGE